MLGRGKSRCCKVWKKTLDGAQSEISRLKSGRDSWISLSTLNLAKAISTEKFFYTPSLLKSDASDSSRLSPQPSALSSELDTERNGQRRTVTTGGKQRVNFGEILGGGDLTFISKNIGKLIDCQHPMLSTVSNYYFNAEGKKLRPLLVLLISKIHSTSTSPAAATNNDQSSSSGGILESQKSLALITEMIHTASLLHDDVIDDADMRRGSPSANIAFGNKLSILAGDFLLSRASVSLAKLGSLQAVQLMAEVIGELVEGEVIQLNGFGGQQRHSQEVKSTFIDQLNAIENLEGWQIECFNLYLRKTFMKTASLMAKSCKSAIYLRDSEDHQSAEAAFDYGMNVGMAFQLIDDYLDFSSSSQELGKPAGGSDLRLGLSTAPVLFAASEFPELQSVICNNSSPSSSAEKEKVVLETMRMVSESGALEKTKMLAAEFSARARDSLLEFKPSSARDALDQLAVNIVNRSA